MLDFIMAITTSSSETHFLTPLRRAWKFLFQCVNSLSLGSNTTNDVIFDFYLSDALVSIACDYKELPLLDYPKKPAKLHLRGEYFLFDTVEHSETKIRTSGAPPVNVQANCGSQELRKR